MRVANSTREHRSIGNMHSSHRTRVRVLRLQQPLRAPSAALDKQPASVVSSSSGSKSKSTNALQHHSAHIHGLCVRTHTYMCGAYVCSRTAELACFPSPSGHRMSMLLASCTASAFDALACPLSGFVAQAATGTCAPLRVRSVQTDAIRTGECGRTQLARSLG